jgi:hypothetical protein
MRGPSSSATSPREHCRAPGTFDHAVLLGKLAFHTALGLPDNGIFGQPLRDIVPLEHRGKASADAWSDCASCHADGLSDNVTWIFATGPRQTLPLDAFFSKLNPPTSASPTGPAVMGSITGLQQQRARRAERHRLRGQPAAGHDLPARDHRGRERVARRDDAVGADRALPDLAGRAGSGRGGER